jgi:amidophosphoribosyltransferase
MSGLFGITGHTQASRMAYFGLYAQQHRGQESAGIVSWSGRQAHAHINIGLVPDVFTEEVLERLPGETAIGHVRLATGTATGQARLPTAGLASKRDAHPLIAQIRGKNIALAHNGGLTNAAKLRADLENNGAIFQSSDDSELFLHLIARSLRGSNIEEAILDACAQVEGAYSLVMLVDGRIFAIRDPHGMRPLALGKSNGSYIVASETCAFDLLEADLVRSLEPGEMLVINGPTLTSHRLPASSLIRQCIFELVYFARPDSNVFGEDVYQCRKHMGMVLASEDTPPDGDYTVPFPDSGIYAAVGFAQASGIPFEHALIRNHYVGRTFIQPTPSMRQFSVRVKINPVRSMIDGKSLCIVDDSIVRGTTARMRVSKLRDLGAKRIHFRVSCPPVRYSCHYGISFADPRQLVAWQHKPEGLTTLLGLDTLHFLSEQGLKSSVSHPENYCLACLNGEYPTIVKNS